MIDAERTAKIRKWHARGDQWYDRQQMGDVLAHIGALEARLAKSKAAVEAADALEKILHEGNWWMHEREINEVRTTLRTARRGETK